MSVNALAEGTASFHDLVQRALSTASSPQPIPPAIVQWMARLLLLEKVPFEYLVPHPDMLPVESIRFFVMDGNWILRAIEGAASAGVGSSRDAIATLQLLEQSVGQLFQAATQIRSLDRGVTATLSLEAGTAGTPMAGGWSGFLLRSCAVQYWPGMEVTAADSSNNALPLLRMERLSPDVLLCLFNGPLHQVSIMQPPETLHFGVAGVGSSAPYTHLRGLTSGQNAGMPLPNDPHANVSFRNGQYPGVMKTNATTQNIKTALGSALPGAFTSAEFAIEMVLTAGLQSFTQS